MKQHKKATTKHKVYGATTVEHMTSRLGGLTGYQSGAPKNCATINGTCKQGMALSRFDFEFRSS